MDKVFEHVYGVITKAKQLKTYICYHKKSNGVANNTDSYNKHFTASSVPQDIREQIHNSCDKAFHSDKLGVKAHEDDHEEKESRPDRRVLHLCDGFGVRDKDEARS